MIKRVNLTSGRTTMTPVDPALLHEYLGGVGLSARMMADISNSGLRPLDPEVPLVVSGGIMNGTGFPSMNRSCFYSLSPLTGLFAPSWMGGNFGTGLARSGTLALVLEGKAPQPSIIIVDEGSVEIVPRPDLWGLTVSQTRAALKRDYGTVRSAVIGPAGERLVPMACVRGDEGHAAGRCGMGAVVGSKNVKAIIARGNAKPEIVDPQGFKVFSRAAMEAAINDPFLKDTQGPIGTPQLVEPVNTFEAFPTSNHRARYFPKADRLYGERIAEEFMYKRTTCPACPVRCRLHVRIDGEEMEAAEYETVWAFGGDNLVDDYALVARANALCNDLGIDSMSAGNTIAFYREYTDTLDDPSNILDLIRQIAYREGVGDTLAQGTRAAAGQFGVDYAMQVKGLELAAYDPRKFIGMAISYSTANRGGDHSRAWTVGDELGGKDFTAEELARMVANYHDAGLVHDSLISCTFVHGAVKSWYPQALTCITGEPYDEERLARIGERIYTLERAMNVRRGVDASQDVLPRRLREGLVSPEKYREGMRIYYELRGWDANGHPTAEKLASLGLDFMV